MYTITVTMKNVYLKTVSETINELTARGYYNDFIVREEFILCVPDNKHFQPEDLEIIDIYRFEGITDPADEAEVMVIEAKDGTKGTMTVAYGAFSGQGSDMIKRIPVRK